MSRDICACFLDMLSWCCSQCLAIQLMQKLFLKEDKPHLSQLILQLKAPNHPPFSVNCTGIYRAWRMASSLPPYHSLSS
ncbi:hypothetical protein BDV93DRAFT_521161 [Ceratobasidium sp. AG-I]|nr:hypothetical protein BDV93DRAFT_521161 [Ceratobasidium sp. AG-I]